MVRKHYQLMMNMLHIPYHQSLLNVTDVVTDVHWNLSICAQVPVQRSDVHNTNASTSEYAHQTSSVDGEV